MTKNLPKIIVVLGPTASGKTDLGLELAKKFNGEIINADSRQVYKEMNIGTAKPTGEWRLDSRLGGNDKSECGDKSDTTLPFTTLSLPAGKQAWKGGKDFSVPQNGNSVYIVDGVPHYLMDIVRPDEEFTLADFKKQANLVIKDILSRGKMPILVGGTGLYIQAIIDNLDIPAAVPNKELRAELEKKTLEELANELTKIDPKAAKTVDLKNPRRVIRALEVATITGESFVKQKTKSAPLYNFLQIGIDLPRAVLYERINSRVDKQMEDGLLEETRELVAKYKDSSPHFGGTQNDSRLDPSRSLPSTKIGGGNDKTVWNLPSMSGIGYKQMGYFLRGEMTLPEAIEILKRDTRRYAKRQITWFKRDKQINWIKDLPEAEKLVQKFI